MLHDGTNRKRIDVDQLEVGMYCEDVYNEEGVFILSASIPVSNLEQISILKRLGVKSVEIDISKGKDVSLGPRKESSGPILASLSTDSPTSFGIELPRARDVYSKTMEAARDAVKSLKLGKEFPAREIEDMAEEVVGSILRNPDALMGITQIKGYDEGTFEHSVNVAILTCSLAHSIGYERDVLKEAGIGGLLHDIGKTWIPENIVNKPAKYTEAEFTVMKRHPEYGIEIIKGRKGISDMSKVVIIQHHERINGQGYPRGLKGNQIHPIGLIAGLVDAYDAMTSNRVYRPSMTPQQALATIYNEIDKEYPKVISEHFVKLLGVYPVGSFVRLCNGEMGIVVKINRSEIMAPDVLMLYSRDGRKLAVPIEYRLSQKIKEKGGDMYAIEKSLSPRTFGVNVADYLKVKISV
jgi:putative nucleotidyltransferase with HDIG domain